MRKTSQSYESRKWPEKVIHRGFVFRPYAVRKRKGYYDTVRYERSSNVSYDRTFGIIRLPTGWQDMDRTWTAQDIYWTDKYDCLNERRGAVSINKLLENERL